MALPTTPTTASPDPARIRALIYGTPGAGKTTFAARWFPETTLLIDLEGGTRMLPGQHFVVRPETYTAFQMVVNELLTQQHQFKAVVIDTADALVRMAEAEAAAKFGKQSAAEVEYGKGMGNRDAVVLRDLLRLKGSDLGLIVTAHPVLADVKLGDEDAQSWFPRIDQQDRIRQAVIGEFDYLLAIRKHPDESRDLVTGGTPGIETKRRVALPNVMPADPAALQAAVIAAYQQINTPTPTQEVAA